MTILVCVLLIVAVIASWLARGRLLLLLPCLALSPLPAVLLLYFMRSPVPGFENQDNWTALLLALLACYGSVLLGFASALAAQRAMRAD